MHVTCLKVYLLNFYTVHSYGYSFHFSSHSLQFIAETDGGVHQCIITRFTFLDDATLLAENNQCHNSAKFCLHT